MTLTSKERRAELARDRDPIALTESYSIRPYVTRIPNREALGTSFKTEKAEFHLVLLPRLSIQGSALG